MGLLKMKFNGIEIPIKITKINRNPGPEVSNNMLTIGSKNGEDFLYSRYSSKKMQIEYQIENRTARDLSEFRRNLAKMLHFREPKQVIFSDEPNLYYNAILDGEPTLEEDDMYSTGTITILVPDGLAHSMVEKTFQAQLNEEGIMEATIYNDGTEECAVNYTIEHNHENGYIGIASEYGAMQYGKIDEVDSETLQRSEELFRFDGYDAFSAMTNGQGILTEDFPKNGTWREDTYNDRLVSCTE